MYEEMFFLRYFLYHLFQAEIENEYEEEIKKLGFDNYTGDFMSPKSVQQFIKDVIAEEVFSKYDYLSLMTYVKDEDDELSE